MKKFALLLIGVLFAFSLQAQWVTKGQYTYIKPYGTYIGIGTDKPTANLHNTGTSLFEGLATFSVLPSFTIAAGTVTPTLLGDTIGFAVAGLTTSAKVIVCPGEYIAPTDTAPYVKSVKTGWLTIGGKNGKKINYWIPKK